MTQSINRFSTAFWSLSQYVSLIMPLQCFTDLVYFYFENIKKLNQNYIKHVSYKFVRILSATGRVKNIFSMHFSEENIFDVLYVYRFLWNPRKLDGHLQKGRNIFMHTQTVYTRRVWISLTVMRSQKYIWECSDGFFHQNYYIFELIYIYYSYNAEKCIQFWVIWSAYNI